MSVKVIVRLFVCLCFVIVLLTPCESKRGGGGRRGGTYRGSSSVWSKSKQSATGSNYDLYSSNRGKSKNQPPPPEVAKKVDAPKASAPPAPHKNADAKETSGAFLNQERAHDAQQKPIGWDTQSKNSPANNQPQQPIGWNVNRDSGSVSKQSVSNVGNSPPYTPGNAYGNPPPYSPNGGQHNYGNPPAYSGNAGQTNYGYPPAYSAGVNQHVNPPPYSYGSGVPPQQSFGSPYGSNPHQAVPNYQPNPHYGGGMYNPYGGGYGGGYGGQKPGLLGSMFGGNKYGGMGYGVGGYGKKFGGGFGMGFGKNAYRNLAIGLLVWNLVSGFTRRPYYVYNYYNNPEKVPAEIPLPANAIVMCPENTTSLCAPNTLPLCTSQESIFCVALAQQTVPCGDNSTMKCVNSTVTCKEGDDDNCNEFAGKNDTGPVNVPCVSSVIITGKLSESAVPLANAGNTTNFCVTTMAMPQPEEDIKKTEENNNCTSNSTSCSELPSAPIGVSLNSTIPNSSGNNETQPLAM